MEQSHFVDIYTNTFWTCQAGHSLCDVHVAQHNNPCWTCHNSSNVYFETNLSCVHDHIRHIFRAQKEAILTRHREINLYLASPLCANYVIADDVIHATSGRAGWCRASRWSATPRRRRPACSPHSRTPTTWCPPPWRRRRRHKRRCRTSLRPSDRHCRPASKTTTEWCNIMSPMHVVISNALLEQ